MLFRRLTRPFAPVCLALTVFGSLGSGAVMAAPTAKTTPPVTVQRITYHGWRGALRLSNGIVEAVVVPEIGRIMAFQYVGHPETNPLLNNKDWAGKTVADADAATWANFGGDKLWPAPQSDWPAREGRGWPPDQAFDGDPEIAQILPSGVRLVAPVSAAFALRASRTLTLKPGQARLYIAQTFTKDPDAANPKKTLPPDLDPLLATRLRRDGFPVGLWSVTQTRGDGTVFLPLDPSPTLPAGFLPLGLPGIPPPGPPSVTAGSGLLRVVCDPKSEQKVGVASPRAWLASLYAGSVLFSEHFTFQPGAAYPDGGLSAEVYSNPSMSYIEMELLGPLVSLAHGEKTTHDIYWQLQRLPRVPQSRADADALVDAAMQP